MSNYSSHPLYKKHDLDSVMSSLWSFYKQHFVVLFIISFIFSIGMQFLSSTIDIQGLQSTTDPAEMLEKLKGMIIPISIAMVVNILLMVLVQYYVIEKPISGDDGVITILLRSIRFFPTYIIIIVLLAIPAALLTMLGLIAFLVGIFFTMLYVIMVFLFFLPVLIAENNDIGNAISRGLSLSHRGYWANMGWVAVVLLILVIVSFVFSAIIMIPFSGNFLKMITDPAAAQEMLAIQQKPMFILFSALVNGLTTPVIPILSTIMYFNGIAREQSINDSTPPAENKPLSVEDLYAKPRQDESST